MVIPGKKYILEKTGIVVETICKVQYSYSNQNNSYWTVKDIDSTKNLLVSEENLVKVAN